ncbi:Restriction endonuclease [uncultured archaeon]|nr:Restriction endonuclease [uncultured archaeon]
MEAFRIPTGPVDSKTFDRLVSAFIEKMGFEIVSKEPRLEGGWDMLAKTTNPMGGRIFSLIYASPSNEVVGADKIRELLERMRLKQAARSAYITLGSFSDEAVELSKTSPVSLLGKYKLVESVESQKPRESKSGDNIMESLKSLGFDEKYYKGEVHAFDLGLSLSQAKDYFAGLKNRKKPLSLFGGKSSPAEVVGGFAPVEIFRVAHTKTEEAEAGLLMSSETEELVFVNLLSAELYNVVPPKKKGKTQTEAAIKSSKIFATILDLPFESRTTLLELVTHGDAPKAVLDPRVVALLKKKELVEVYDDAEKKASEKPFLEGLVESINENIVIIMNELLSAMSTGGEGKKDDKKEEEKKEMVKAKIPLPHLEGGSYSLLQFLVIEKGLEEDFAVDEPRYGSLELLPLMRHAFKGDVTPLGLMYMPYYRCRFVDSSGETKGWEVLVAPRFKASEMKAARDFEASSQKKTAKAKWEGKSKFSTQKFRVVR